MVGFEGYFHCRRALEELELAFDHKEIITDAYRQIQMQMLQTTIAKQFCRHFTGELYQVIQTVMPDFESLILSTK